MPKHLLLRGDGAGKFLPFARNKLMVLRGLFDDLDAYSQTLKVRSARIQLSWAGNEERISILGIGDEFFSLSHGKIRASKYVRAGAFKGITFAPPEAPTFLSSPRPMGGGFCIYLGRSADLLTGYIYLSPGGIALKKIVEGGAAFFLNTAYTGLVRDEDGKAVSKELISIGYTPAGFGVFSEGSAAVGQTNGFVGSFPLGIPAALGTASFGVNSTTGPLFCGDRTSLVTISFPSPTRRIIFHSVDGGRNWDVGFDEADLPAGVTFLRSPFLMDADGTIGLWILDSTGTPEVQLWRSNDRGASFAFWVTPPTEWQDMVNFNSRTFFTVTLGLGAFLVLATKSAPPTVWTQIARTLDYGNSWEIFPEEFNGTDATSYAVLMRVYQTMKDEATDPAPNPEKARLVVPVFQPGEGYFCYLSDDGGETWRLGPLIDPSTATPTFTSPFVVEHLGTLHRPQPADIVFPHLHDNPV